MKRILLHFILWFVTCFIAYSQDMTGLDITQYWHTGKTLPLAYYEHSPKIPLNLKNDNGYNVLLDVAHQCDFATMWQLPPRLHKLGYRAHASHAALNSVLSDEGVSRRRIPYDLKNGIRPFAWCPNLKYNVVVTDQTIPGAQPYTGREIASLKAFVEKGGGLVIMAHPVSEDRKQDWSLNTLLKVFDTELGANVQEGNLKATSFVPTDSWTVDERYEGKSVQMRRVFGRGRVIVFGNASRFDYTGKDAELPANKVINELVANTLEWLCREQQPVGGFFPARTGGGGDIYPEKEVNADGIVVYYAENQIIPLLNVITVEFPKITRQIYEWYPSKPTSEPMYLLLCAGNGGGWAVNAFKPKENGIISLNPDGIISIYAHELAHTMKGPVNDKGETAGVPPIPNSGEAHVGWFQGKINAMYNSDLLSKPNRYCDKVFKEAYFKDIDFTKYYENEALRERFGKTKDWNKTWYIWQRLDDTYGPTWYTRWKWIQHTRWQETPQYKLTWEEMVEDMSIAVGQDLFPFMKQCGIQLSRDQIGIIIFRDKKIRLPPARIEVTFPGPVRLEAIVDYKKELK